MSETKITKPAVTSVPIAETLANRWSPRVFDESFELSDQASVSLLEAARWAPSSSNEQPWRFVYARRGEELFRTVVEGLIGFNQQWVPSASAVIVVLVAKHAANGTAASMPIAYYNAALASSQIVFQAETLGLKSHYMSGIDFPALEASLDLPELQIVACIAVGKQGDVSLVSKELAEREALQRERKDLSEIVVRGLPDLH